MLRIIHYADASLDAVVTAIYSEFRSHMVVGEQVNYRPSSASKPYVDLHEYLYGPHSSHDLLLRLLVTITSATPVEPTAKPKKSEEEPATSEDQYDPDAWEYSVAAVAQPDAKLPTKIPGSHLK